MLSEDEDEDGEREKCEAEPCSIGTYKLKTVKWVQCENCTKWFHLYCLGLKAVATGAWYCSVCAPAV